MNEGEDETPTVYTLRIGARARRDMDAAIVRFADEEGEAIAVEWEQGVFDLIRSLATLPRRYVIADNARYFRGEVRQVVYRRTSNSAPCLLVYRIAEGNANDTPMVNILFLRHAAAKPLTRREAREIEAQNAE